MELVAVLPLFNKLGLSKGKGQDFISKKESRSRLSERCESDGENKALERNQQSLPDIQLLAVGLTLGFVAFFVGGSLCIVGVSHCFY
jgi:hypothetical protein